MRNYKRLAPIGHGSADPEVWHLARGVNKEVYRWS